MKKIIVIPVIVISCAVGKVFAVETNQVASCETAIVRALTVGDIQNLSPSLEKLWPHQPELYFKYVTKAAGVVATNKTSESRPILVCLFTNMMQKQNLTNSSEVLLCMTRKSAAIPVFLNYEEIRNEKLPLLVIAKYVGDVRAHIIPDFIGKPVYLNAGAGFEPGSPEQTKAIDENERNKAENNFQETMQITDTKTTHKLLVYASRFSSRVSTNADFVAKVVEAAHLTENEQKRLK